jgi:HlyB family type I secretion system ABC transporter
LLGLRKNKKNIYLQYFRGVNITMVSKTSAFAKQILTVIHTLNLDSADPHLVNDLSGIFETYEFQLGDEVVANKQSRQLQDPTFDNLNNIDLHLIIKGRVRLLSFDENKQRKVSVLLLEEGETFGADSLGGEDFFPYDAIAASAGIGARIAVSQLRLWLERLPQLDARLQQDIRRRQCLIFLKTLTELRTLAGTTLLQLYPYLKKVRIAAGKSLFELTSSNLGRYWLYSGTIQTQESEPSAPQIGDSWGYPLQVPGGGIAQTNLLVYMLPAEYWETALAIAPNLADADILRRKVEHDGDIQDRAEFNGRHCSVTSQPSILRNAPKSYSPRIVYPPELGERQPKLNATASGKISKPGLIPFPQRSNQLTRRRLPWVQYPFIRQQSSTDCGSACLAMIAQYWGKRFSLNFLRELAGVGRSGTSLKGLAKAGEGLGFQVSPVRASLNKLADRQNPWIAHWQGDHYVVVYQVKRNRIVISDPAVGKQSLSHKEFLNGWTGYALLLEPTAQLAATETEKRSLGRFLGLLWPHRAIIGQIIFASLLLQIFGLITPLFTQIILDRVVVNKSFFTLNVFAIGLIIFGAWRTGLAAARQYLLDYFSNRLDLTFLSGFINHTLSLPLKFFEFRQVGDILTRIQETQKIQVFLTRQAVSTWLDTLMIFVYVGLMSYYNWQLTLLVLALIVPIALLTVLASPFLRKMSREIFNEDAKQNSLLIEMMTGVATVKATATEQEVRWRWEDRLTSLLNVRFRGQKLANGLQVLSGSINTLGSAALLWYGATLVIKDQLTVGQFVAFNMLIGNVITPILALVRLWDEFQEILVSVERLDDVFTTPPEEDFQTPMLSLPKIEGDVQFENVFFRYGSEEEAYTLNNISFSVHTGQTVAIVGRSGSGKSTLAKLLQALYYPTSGRICIDGHDIRHISPQSLRSQLGVVPQECFLFSGTILENIALYRSGYTLEQVIEVAKFAEAHSFIQSLPLGYNTKIGERGSNLSGGQQQRIAIARALLGNPAILIFDEATSSLDTESERRFQENLSRISRDRTTFVIAHRLSTVRNADCILVLDRGIVSEAGTQDELIAQKGLYYHLAQQQLDL